MGRTQIKGNEIKDGTVQVADLDVAVFSNVVPKKTFALNLLHSAPALDVWLGVGDSNCVSNNTAWSPALNLKLLYITFTNSGIGTAATPIKSTLNVYYDLLSNNSATLTTADILLYSFNSIGATSISGYGKAWKFDMTGSNIQFTTDKEYAFNMKKVSGASIANVVVTMYLQEI